MPRTKSKTWKLERACVHRKGSAKPRSNKYSKSDNDERPNAGSRSRVWVGGYTRSDGIAIKGHYRAVH